jgi:hypothetical protein
MKAGKQILWSSGAIVLSVVLLAGCHSARQTPGLDVVSQMDPCRALALRVTPPNPNLHSMPVGRPPATGDERMAWNPCQSRAFSAPGLSPGGVISEIEIK